MGENLINATFSKVENVNVVKLIMYFRDEDSHSHSDKVNSTRIYASTISGLRTFHKYTNTMANSI